MAATMENESTFVAPEGVYTVTEQLKPSLAHIHPPNTPHVFPTKLSFIVIPFPAPKQAGPGLAQLLGGNKENKKEKEKEKEREKEKLGQKDDGVSLSSSDTPDDGYTPTDPAAPMTEGTVTNSTLPTLFSHPQAPSKKKPISRPKHNMRTTSSTFITRIQTAEGLTKVLQSKHGETTFLFYNIAKNFCWVDTGSKSKEPLARVSFSAYPTCHDVNTLTASSERVDIIIGFNTGDLVWFDPISSRYNRLNKGGCISSSPCTAVRWVPSSSTLFLVSHVDGTIIVYDKERDDGIFTPRDPVQTPNQELHDALLPATQDHPPPVQQGEWDPLDKIFVTVPPWHPVPSVGGPGNGGKGDREKEKEKDKDKVVKNPVSHWRLSRRSVVDFVFSPDVKYVAAIAEDGCLRVIDALAEQLVDCYASYFGSLTCVSWSPDGRFIITGGQDDLLTIFSPSEQRVVARCQGHSSFVAAVAFDEQRCDGRTYRFGSVGEDNKLILWDFSSGALHRPKFQASHHHRFSMSSTHSLSNRRDRSALFLPTDSNDSPLPRYHPAPSRNEIAIVQPVLMKTVETSLLTCIAFLPRAVITATKSGHIKLWIRPLEVRSRHLKRGQGVDIQALIS